VDVTDCFGNTEEVECKYGGDYSPGELRKERHYHLELSHQKLGYELIEKTSRPVNVGHRG